MARSATILRHLVSHACARPPFSYPAVSCESNERLSASLLAVHSIINYLCGQLGRIFKSSTQVSIFICRVQIKQLHVKQFFITVLIAIRARYYTNVIRLYLDGVFTAIATGSLALLKDQHELQAVQVEDSFFFGWLYCLVQQWRWNRQIMEVYKPVPRRLVSSQLQRHLLAQSQHYSW